MPVTSVCFVNLCLSLFLCFISSPTPNKTLPSDIKNNNSHQKKSITAANSKGSSSSSPAVIKSHKSSSSKASKLPSWSQDQLQEAITSVITQRMRFTQASSRFNIPKGTLYDNILGKSRRMKALEEVGLTSSEELAVLEYCCEISTMPYNRRTSRSLKENKQVYSSYLAALHLVYPRSTQRGV